MKTWNPIKLVRNLFVCANSSLPADRAAFWSAGFRLTAWGISLIFIGYLVYEAAAVILGQEGIDLRELALDTERKVLYSVLSLRGLEGLVDDVRQRV